MLDNGKFKIIKSDKAGLTSEESLLVVRNNVSYLRILGKEPQWEVMTATASEDDGGIQVCRDRIRLVESAIRLCHAMKMDPNNLRDRHGREYVKICIIVREDHDTDTERELIGVIERFFQEFDTGPQPPGHASDMVDIYESISHGGDGEDVYLSDGVWLSRDGSLHDRGR